MYNFKRALGFSVLVYVTTFVIGLVAGILGKVDMSSMENTPDYFWYVGMIVSVVLIAIFTKLYFKSPTVRPSAKSGLMFGLTAVAVSFLLDFATFSIGGMGDQLGMYFGDYRYWIMIVLVVLTAKLVGHMKGKASQVSM